MADKDPTQKKKTVAVALAAVALAVVIAAVVFMKKPEPPAPQPAQQPRVPVKNQPLIEFNSGQEKTRDLMQERKAEYGMDKGVDMIARSDETVKIGGETVSMQEIADKIRLESGKIVESDIGGKGPGGKVQVFGIYVVQPNDNIWNIHFRFLKEYFKNRGIPISPMADEPDKRGFSSGVGKLLKFSENIVHIYNIKERKLETDLNVIYPMSKIVVYNMGQVFSLLDSIDYSQVDRIEFDGENIWLAAKK